MICCGDRDLRNLFGKLLVLRLQRLAQQRFSDQKIHIYCKILRLGMKNLGYKDAQNQFRYKSKGEDIHEKESKNLQPSTRMAYL